MNHSTSTSGRPNFVVCSSPTRPTIRAEERSITVHAPKPQRSQCSIERSRIAATFSGVRSSAGQVASSMRGSPKIRTHSGRSSRSGGRPVRRSVVTDDKWWGQDSNLRRLGQRVYSPSPLTAREPHREGRKSSEAGATNRPARAACSARVAEALGLRERLELLQGVVLDLPDPLARDVERAADLLERERARAGEAEAHLDHLALALRERVERAPDVLLAEVLRRHLERRDRGLILDEVAQLGLLLVADRLLEGDGLLRHAQDVAHLARRALGLPRDLLRQRLAAELLDELALDVYDLVELLHHVDGDADRAALVRDRPRHRLADPPGRVRRELVPAAVVELLDGADEAERALLDQVQEGQPAAEVALGDGDDEAQVRLDHLLLGDQVATLDALRQRDRAIGRQQLDLTDRTQVQAQRVEARLDREVDLGLAGSIRLLVRVPGGRLETAPFGGRRTPVGAHDVDPLALQEGVELDDLLLRDLDLLQAGGDLLEGQEPTLLAFGDQRAQLVDLGDRRLALEQCFSLCAQPLDPSRSSAMSGRASPAILRSQYPSVVTNLRRRRGGRGTQWSVFRASRRFVAVETSTSSTAGIPFSSTSVRTLALLEVPCQISASSKTSRNRSPRCTCRSRAWASRTSRRSSGSAPTGRSACTGRSSTASSISGRSRRARTCRASRRSSTTRSARSCSASGPSAPRRWPCTSPRRSATARAPAAPRCGSRRATPSTSRPPSRASRPRSSTRC